MKRQVDRMVRDRNGKLFVETHHSEYDDRMKEWSEDKTRPVPVPCGSLIFQYPQDHNCVLLPPEEAEKILYGDIIHDAGPQKAR